MARGNKGSKMSHNFRVIKHKGHVPEADWVGMHEVYYDEHGNIHSWHETPVTVGNDLDDLIGELRNQLFAAESAKSKRNACRVLDEAEMPMDEEGEVNMNDGIRLLRDLADDLADTIEEEATLPNVPRSRVAKHLPSSIENGRNRPCTK